MTEWRCAFLAAEGCNTASVTRAPLSALEQIDIIPHCNLPSKQASLAEIGRIRETFRNDPGPSGQAGLLDVGREAKRKGLSLKVRRTAAARWSRRHQCSEKARLPDLRSTDGWRRRLDPPRSMVSRTCPLENLSGKITRGRNRRADFSRYARMSLAEENQPNIRVLQIHTIPIPEGMNDALLAAILVRGR